MKNLDLSIKICEKVWKNPLTTASGTFAPEESSNWYNPEILGAVILKGVSPTEWLGNPSPRIAETYGGMLNSVGLQNLGVEHFKNITLPKIQNWDTVKIANIAGHSIEEYVEVCDSLNDSSIDIFEINISCPNIKCGGISFGTNPELAGEVTREVKKIAKKPVFIKLSPNVSDIVVMAKAVEAEGADGITLINTLLGMKIDVNSSKAVLANKMGGLSGACIKPVAIRMVYQVRNAVKIPIIGLGGVENGEDVAEFIMAGADAVAVGTTALVEPTAPVRILAELEEFMQRRGFKNLREIRQSFLDREKM